MFQFGESQSARPVLPSLRVPTLLLHREGDRHRPVADTRAMASQIRNAQLCILPGADHVPWVGDTDAILSALHTFLAGLPTAPISGSLAGCVLAVTAGGGSLPPTLLNVVRRELMRHRAFTIDSQLDHVLVAYFDGPGRAVECGLDLSAAAAAQGLQATVGLDMGSLTLSPVLAGEAVDQAIALAMLAAPGEILVSDAVRTLTAAAELDTSERVVAAVGQATRIIYEVRRRPPAPTRSAAPPCASP
jgi:hypothetical protein